MTNDCHIRQLHAEYVRLTGMDIALTMRRIYAWEQWSAHGWTGHDLALVVRFREKRWERDHVLPSYKFRWLIEATDDFEEALAEARAWRRQKHHSNGKSAVLRATGRESEPVLPKAQQVGDVMRGKEALEALRALRDSL